MESFKEFGKGVLRIGAGVLLLGLGIEALFGLESIGTVITETSQAVSGVLSPSIPVY